MEIIKIEESGDIKYFTIKVVNKFIKAEKVIELIDNVEDYIDKENNFDKDSFKEDVLEPREYLITLKGKKAECTCKNSLFRKTPCRHIKFCEEYLKNVK